MFKTQELFSTLKKKNSIHRLYVILYNTHETIFTFVYLLLTLLDSNKFLAT